MNALTDEDGVDGPFERAMARAERKDKRADKPTPTAGALKQQAPEPRTELEMASEMLAQSLAIFREYPNESAHEHMRRSMWVYRQIRLGLSRSVGGAFVELQRILERGGAL